MRKLGHSSFLISVLNVMFMLRNSFPKQRHNAALVLVSQFMTTPTRVTLHDIASSLDAPLDQVTKVILGQPGVTDDFRQRVFGALEHAGIVRVSRANTTTGTIAVVIPGAVVGDYIGEVVRGANAAAEKNGCALALHIENAAKEEDVVRLLESQGCIGLILVVPNVSEPLLALCEKYNRDYVLVDHQGDDVPDDVLTIDVKNRESIIQVINILLDLGHRRIGFITGRLDVASARQRLQGYEDALANVGIPFDPLLVKEGDWLHPRGYAVAQALLDLENPPTAIVASNDLSAFGAMQAAAERGLVVGKDIAITGFDDIDMAATVTPSLTTVRQPMFRMGETAVEMLIKRSRGEKVTRRHVQFDTELILRQSTSAPK
jgi:LacI family transcriptional regulator